jgi:hypothetical protein
MGGHPCKETEMSAHQNISGNWFLRQLSFKKQTLQGWKYNASGRVPACKHEVPSSNTSAE